MNFFLKLGLRNEEVIEWERPGQIVPALFLYMFLGGGLHQGLLLALPSNIASDRLREPYGIWDTGFSCVQGIHHATVLVLRPCILAALLAVAMFLEGTLRPFLGGRQHGSQSSPFDSGF